MKSNILSKKYLRYTAFAVGGIFLGWLIFHSPRTKGDIKNTVSEEKQNTIWTCAMHPQIRMSEPGKCPICGMELIPLSQTEVVSDPDAVHFTREAAQLANVMTTIVTKENPVKE